MSEDTYNDTRTFSQGPYSESNTQRSRKKSQQFFQKNGPIQVVNSVTSNDGRTRSSTFVYNDDIDDYNRGNPTYYDRDDRDGRKSTISSTSRVGRKKSILRRKSRRNTQHDGGRDSHNDPHMNEAVHHHHHYKPKDHEENFEWLKYQYERRVSAVGRATAAAEKQASWENLNDNSSFSWWNLDWSWNNLLYFWDEFKAKCYLWWMSFIGLAASEQNIKAFGSHKEIYIQNLRLTKAMRENDIKYFLIHPHSHFKIIFDMINFFLCIILVVILPRQICRGQFKIISDVDKKTELLSDPGPANAITSSLLELYFSIFCDLWFLLDIFINFCVCYQSDSKEIVMDPDDIFNNYLLGWCAIDVLATFPFEVLTSCSMLFAIIENSYLSDMEPGPMALKISKFIGFFKPVPSSMSGSSPVLNEVGNCMGQQNTELSLGMTLTAMSKNNNVLKFLKISKMMKMLKLLRICRGLRFIKFMGKFYEDQYDKVMFFSRIGLLTLTLAMILHFFAHIFIASGLCYFKDMSSCIHYRLGAYPGGWIDTHPDLDNDLIPNMFTHGDDIPSFFASKKNSLTDIEFSSRVYMWSLFIAASHMFCIGYGLSSPTERELLPFICSIFLCAIAYGVLVSMIISTMQEQNQRDQKFQEKFGNLKRYLAYREIPFELQERIHMYYEFRYGGKIFDEDMILSELNPVLRKTVIKYNQKWLVNSTPMFEDCSIDFRDAVAQVLRYELYLADDILYSAGDRATEVFFIQGGTVSILVNGEQVGRKIDGEIFGELALLLPDIFRLATAVCDSSCYIYELDIVDYRKICKDFPSDYKQVLNYGKFRLEEESFFYKHGKYEDVQSQEQNNNTNRFDGNDYDPDELFNGGRNSRRTTMKIKKALASRTSRYKLRELKDQMRNDELLATLSLTNRRASHMNDSRQIRMVQDMVYGNQS